MSASAAFVIALFAVAFFWYATRDVVVDVPIRPLAIPTLRRRWYFWWAKLKNLLRYVAGGAIVLFLFLGLRVHLPSLQSVNIVSDAGGSGPVQAGVLATMTDYFSGLDTASLCRYSRAFSPALRPPPLTDCNVTLDSGITVRKIEGLPNNALGVQADFRTRHKLPLGMSVCTAWTGNFFLRKTNGDWLIASTPQLQGTPGRC